MSVLTIDFKKYGSMRIICEKGEFELPVDFQVQYQLNNVAISDAGEQTAPLTLPGTPHNMSLIGHSWRPDSLVKPLEDLDVFVIDGWMIRPCNMGIHSASGTEGIECTLYLDSGSLYSRMGNTRLNWFGWPEVKCPDYDTVTHEERVRWLVGELKDEFFNSTCERDWCVVALRTTKDVTWVTPGGEEHATKLVLNDYAKYTKLEHHTFPPMDYSDADSPSELDGEKTGRTWRTDGADVKVGLGFGMTAFLRVRYMLDFLFGYYGYAFDHGEISSVIEDYDLICVVNNVADAIYAGRLKYRQLVPDVTVKEFLSETQKIFGGVFVFDEPGRRVHFHTYEKLLTLAPDFDLTPYACGEALLEKPEFGRPEVTDRNATEEGTGQQDDSGEKIEVGLPRQTHAEDGWWYVSGIPNVNPPTGDYRWTASFPRRLPEAEGVRLLNSELKLPEDGKEQETTAAEDKESKAGADITFLNARKRGYIDSTYLTGRDVETGKEVSYELRLHYDGTGGLYHYEYFPYEQDMKIARGMYKEYIAFKEKSNIPVSVRTVVPATTLCKLNLLTPKFLYGQPVLIERIETTSGLPGMEPVQTVYLRTLRKYGDG